MADCLQQLGELPSKRMTDKDKVQTLENMLTQAEQKHFEAVVNGAWNPAKRKEADQIKDMMETLEKQLAAVKARIKPEPEDAGQ